MTAHDLLVSAITTDLSGDRERVVELFHDATLHARLAAAPDAGSTLHYREEPFDGWYFVACDGANGRPGEYLVYAKERGGVSDQQRFADSAAAAAYFFSSSGFIAQRQGPVTAVAGDEGDTEAPARPPVLVRAVNLTEALGLGLVGVVLVAVGVFMLWSFLPVPGFPGAILALLVGLLCLYGSYRAWRNRSQFQSMVVAPLEAHLAAAPQADVQGARETTEPLRTSAQHAHLHAQEAALHSCTGFLDAMASLNSAPGDRYAQFFLAPLPAAPDLQQALTRYFDDYVNENIVVVREGDAAHEWGIDTCPIEVPRKYLAAKCEKWFFGSEHMRMAPPATHRANLIASFLHSVGLVIGMDGVTHSVSIAPPGWFAIDWDLVAFERGEQRFLLQFSHSD